MQYVVEGSVQSSLGPAAPAPLHLNNCHVMKPMGGSGARPSRDGAAEVTETPTTHTAAEMARIVPIA